jgi:hypothetical protein
MTKELAASDARIEIARSRSVSRKRKVAVRRTEAMLLYNCFRPPPLGLSPTSMRIRIESLFLRLVLVSLFDTAGLAAAEPAGTTVALTGFRLIDGTGRGPIENAVLVIRGDKVSAAGLSDSGKCPEDAQVIDGRGQTIMPGRISDHSHVGLVDGTSIKPENYNRQNIQRQLRQYEAYGVTTVMALGLNGDVFYPLHDQQHAGQSPGADLFGADRGIGGALGASPLALLPIGKDQIYRPETAADVREMVTRHPDLIKLWLDDLLGTAPKVKREIYQAVIEEAH